jgi:hypothetical protein
MNGVRSRLVLAVAAAVMVATLAGCCPCATAPSQSPMVGVWGFTLAGPTCPVERPEQSPCVRAVAGSGIAALDGTGEVAARTKSDSKGYYFLPLAPGTYTIEAQPVEGLMGTPEPVTVQVVDGPPQQLDLTYDTGIR